MTDDKTGDKTLFGWTDEPQAPKKGSRAAHRDYEHFIDKFKPRKTTDDCLTPPEVYDTILAHVRGLGLIDGMNVVRPFWPGADFTRYPYEAGDVVVDNPPFSILAAIIDWYNRHGVRYWLFAPHLTIMSYALRPGITVVIVNGRTTYENGAVVQTSFVTNLYPHAPAVVVDGTLSLALSEASRRYEKRRKPVKVLPSYSYPDCVVTAANLGTWIATSGGHLEIGREECIKINALDCQRAAGKSLYGGGLLLTRVAAARVAAARECIPLRLSPRELDLQARLEAGGFLMEDNDNDIRKK